MEIIYLLIPLSILLVGIIISVFFWSVREGQFDDLEGPGGRILFDNDDITETTKTIEKDAKSE